MCTEPFAATNRRVLVEIDDMLMPGVDAESAQLARFNAASGTRIEPCELSGHGETSNGDVARSIYTTSGTADLTSINRSLPGRTRLHQQASVECGALGDRRQAAQRTAGVPCTGTVEDNAMSRAARKSSE